MLASRRSNEHIAKDVDGWQIPNRSVSPIEPNNDDISLSKMPTISIENENDAKQQQHEQHEREGGEKEVDNAGEVEGGKDDVDRVKSDDMEYYKPVRRGVALAQEIHDEYLICKICLEDFKSPKSLDCMHTFCEECIENHALSESSYKKYSDYREFTCPLCRKRTQLPLGGIRKLPDNYVIAGLLKSVAKRRPLTPILSFVKCDICRSSISYFRSGDGDDSKSVRSGGTGSAPVAARCLDCCKVMCAGCAAAHRSTPVTSSHSVYDPDVVADVLKDQNALACREHCNETVEYYCLDCRRCVCLLCAFDEQAVEPHVNHDLVDFATAAARHQSKLRELCDGAAAETARLETELTELTSCADHVDAVRRLIRSTAETFRRLIDAEERDLLGRLDSTFSDGPVADTRAAAAALRDRVGRLDSVRRLAEKIAERRGVELLLLHEEVENRLEKEQQLQATLSGQQQQQQQQRGSTEASGGLGLHAAAAAGSLRRRLEFVPGVVSLGQLDVTSSNDGTGSGSGEASTGGGRCPTCHRRPGALLREQSSMTVVVAADGATTTSAPVLMLDKAVNTRARGLLHSGGGSGSAGGLRVSRSASLSAGSSSSDLQEHV